MKEIFSFHRFYRLLIKTLLERPVQLFGLSVMSMGLVLLIYFTCMDLILFPGIQVITFFLGLIGGGYFMSASVFNYFSTHSRGASFLTLPASGFEKWLCAVVIVLLGYLPLFLLFYRFMDIAMVEAYRAGLDPSVYNYKKLLERAFILKYDTDEVGVLFKIFFNLSGLMLLGSLYFNRMAIVKVALFFCLILFLAIGINYFIAKTFFHEDITAFPFLSVNINNGKFSINLGTPKKLEEAFSYFFFYTLPVILYLLSFVKLREKQF